MTRNHCCMFLSLLLPLLVTSAARASEESFADKERRENEQKNGYKVIEINAGVKEPTVHWFGDHEHDRAWAFYENTRGTMSAAGGFPAGYSIQPPGVTEGGRARGLKIREQREAVRKGDAPPPAKADPVSEKDNEAKPKAPETDQTPILSRPGYNDPSKKPGPGAKEAIDRDLAALDRDLDKHNRAVHAFADKWEAFKRARSAVINELNAVDRDGLAYNALPDAQKTDAAFAELNRRKSVAEGKAKDLVKRKGALDVEKTGLDRSKADLQKRSNSLVKRRAELSK